MVEQLLPQLELIARLLLAALLGSVIGIERERLNWVAGLRTHMLVSVGAALMMLVSSFGFSDALTHPSVVLDPSRVAAQVVSGIGFLGAGAILLRDDMVRGVNTAASLWSVAGIGLAVGGGMYVAAVGATAIILVILAGMKPLERRLLHSLEPQQLELLADCGAVCLHDVRIALDGQHGWVRNFAVRPADASPGRERVLVTLADMAPGGLDQLAARLHALPGVHACRRASGAGPGA